jgi:hypothetical protein
MKSTDKLSWQAFRNTIEARLVKWDADDLRHIVRILAHGVSPGERRAVLERLKSTQHTEMLVQQAQRQAKLLTEIDDLAQEIQDEIQQADQWEDRHGWTSYYDDEDSLGPYEDFIQPLTALFKRTHTAFNHGNFTLARAAYQKLFEVLELEDDYGRGVREEDVSEAVMGIAHVRYLRAVYDTESSERRPQTLLAQMQRFSPRPLLAEVIQISPQPPPEQERFLADWIAFLHEQKGADADAWLREAIRLARGTEGLAALAQTEGKSRPRAYLDWLAALEHEKRYRDVLVTAQAALRALPHTLPIRAAIADYQYRAAAKLKETRSLRVARWEAFRAKPSLTRLLDLWDVTPGRERAQRMRTAAEHVKAYLAHPPRSWKWLEDGWDEENAEAPVWIERSLLAHAWAGERMPR